MGRVEDETKSKSQLVTEICNISNQATACARWHRHDRVRSPFIDWYLLLQVEENVGMDTIRKQYHKLALQLHPDKNRHPKAEIAFKLVSEVNTFDSYTFLYDWTRKILDSVVRNVPLPPKLPKAITKTGDFVMISFFNISGYNVVVTFLSELIWDVCSWQAYACLSDKARREAFDLGRWNSFCIDCNRTSNIICSTPSNSSEKLTGLFPADRQRSNHIIRGLKDIRTRFMEEARVIENCLKANAASRKVYPSSYASGKESPIFDPSNYQARDYQNRTRSCRKPEGYCCLRTGNAYKQRNAKCDSPIFEYKCEKRSFNLKSVHPTS
ncbi:hypothetical protein RJ639_042470 [Escallonia herrerae]|uniref:J domain-containing protein n=1 Tax=Escallonia herrerae TaxID=1293975 RepID=A0AA88WLF9_9ASTE|nr:hypothetical protein RJ639_042470 [Escallonia herrerae]